MIVCDQCGKQIKNKSITTREEGNLGKTYKIFCNKECMLVYYDQPEKPKNEKWKFPSLKKNTITVKDIRQNEPAIGGEVTPDELGKPLV